MVGGLVEGGGEIAFEGGGNKKIPFKKRYMATRNHTHTHIYKGSGSHLPFPFSGLRSICSFIFLIGQINDYVCTFNHSP